MNEKRRQLLEIVTKKMTLEEQKQWVWEQMRFCIYELIIDMPDEEIEEQLALIK